MGVMAIGIIMSLVLKSWIPVVVCVVIVAKYVCTGGNFGVIAKSIHMHYFRLGSAEAVVKFYIDNFMGNYEERKTELRNIAAYGGIKSLVDIGLMVLYVESAPYEINWGEFCLQFEKKMKAALKKKFRNDNVEEWLLDTSNSIKTEISLQKVISHALRQ